MWAERFKVVTVQPNAKEEKEANWGQKGTGHIVFIRFWGIWYPPQASWDTLKHMAYRHRTFTHKWKLNLKKAKFGVTVLTCNPISGDGVVETGFLGLTGQATILAKSVSSRFSKRLNSGRWLSGLCKPENLPLIPKTNVSKVSFCSLYPLVAHMCPHTCIIHTYSPPTHNSDY